MFDGPSFGDLPGEYHLNAAEPLGRGEGVAAFLILTEGGSRHVLYASYTLGEKTAEIATDERAFIRAAQAIAIQREARVAARSGGYEPVVS